MSRWSFHQSIRENEVRRYQCGLIAGSIVALKKPLLVRDHRGQPTGRIHPVGERWLVLPGIRSDPVVWFRAADGERHTWDDDPTQIADWFEVAIGAEPANEQPAQREQASG